MAAGHPTADAAAPIGGTGDSGFVCLRISRYPAKLSRGAGGLPDAQMIDGATHYLWLTHAQALREPLRDFIGRILPMRA